MVFWFFGKNLDLDSNLYKQKEIKNDSYIKYCFESSLRKLLSNGVNVCMNVGSNPITCLPLFPGLRLIWIEHKSEPESS